MADRGRLHRDENSQSIPVAELLASHKRIRHIEPEPPQVFVDALLQREQQPPPPPAAKVHEPALVTSGRRRLAPVLLGLAAAAAVLAGALVATNTMTRQGEQDAVTAAAAPEHITGAKVFRPDVIRASLNENGNNGAAQDDDGSAPEGAAGDDTRGDDTAGDAADPAAGAPNGRAGASGAVEGAAPAPAGAPAAPAAPAQPPAGAPESGSPATQPAPPAANPPAAPTTSTRSSGGLLGPILEPLDPVTGPILGPILGFYSAAPSQPTAAYQMLASTVQEGTVEEFARSWDGVTEAKVHEATPAGPNAMVVRVSMLRADGSLLVTKQRIVVSSGPMPKIVDAQLLSVRLF